MEKKRMLARFLIFGLMGLLFEVFFGAFIKLAELDWNLRGSSSLWMIMDYGLLGVVLMPIALRLKRRAIPLWKRAFVYMLGIFFVEYVSGVIFHSLMGLRIWDYFHMPYNLHGQIALYYAPLWYVLGLAAETLYRRVDACRVVLVRNLNAEELL